MDQSLAWREPFISKVKDQILCILLEGASKYIVAPKEVGHCDLRIEGASGVSLKLNLGAVKP